MRVLPIVSSALVALALALAPVAYSQPKKADATAHRRGHATSKGTADTAAPTPSGDANPYADDQPTGPAAATTAAPADATPAQTPPSDGKIDDTPPPKSDRGPNGAKPSPLNPEANEFPKSGPAQAPANLDSLLSDIAALRARVAALTTSLFSSKLRVYVHTDGDDARIQAFVVTLDDGTVFRADANFTAEDQKVVYEHAVAPGNHVVGIEVERQDARGASYKTWQVSRFSVQVPERKVLEAIVDVDDDSDMAKDFPGDQDGKYDLRVRLRAKVAE